MRVCVCVCVCVCVWRQFGDKVLRKEPYFVRAVNNYVMVRIGCSWEPLADFFERNDPCRGAYMCSTGWVKKLSCCTVRDVSKTRQ